MFFTVNSEFTVRITQKIKNFRGKKLNLKSLAQNQSESSLRQIVDSETFRIKVIKIT